MLISDYATGSTILSLQIFLPLPQKILPTVHMQVFNNGTISPHRGNTTVGLSCFLTVHWFVEDTHHQKGIKKKRQDY